MRQHEASVSFCPAPCPPPYLLGMGCSAKSLECMGRPEEEEEEEERRASRWCCPQETLISRQQKQEGREGKDLLGKRWGPWEHTKRFRVLSSRWASPPDQSDRGSPGCVRVRAGTYVHGEVSFTPRGHCHSGREPMAWHNVNRDQVLRGQRLRCPAGHVKVQWSLQGDRPGAKRWHRALLCKDAPAFGPTQNSPEHFTNCWFFGCFFFSAPFSTPSALGPPPRTGSFAFPALRSADPRTLSATPAPAAPVRLRNALQLLRKP